MTHTKENNPKETPRNYDYRAHWNRTYGRNPEEKLGWYENDPSATFGLIAETGLPLSAVILNAGAGSTTLIDLLIEKGYRNLIATDISEVALDKLRERTGNHPSVTFISDDLTAPRKLNQIAPVDLWVDRAVLHFFTQKEDRETYIRLIGEKVKPGGFAILAQFNLQSAEKCSGLPVYRYNKEMLEEIMSPGFSLIKHFDYDYTNPSGGIRTYIYTLFKRL